MKITYKDAFGNDTLFDELTIRRQTLFTHYAVLFRIKVIINRIVRLFDKQVRCEITQCGIASQHTATINILKFCVIDVMVVNRLFTYRLGLKDWIIILLFAESSKRSKICKK